MTNIIEHKNQDDELVYWIDKKARRGEYHILTTNRQGEFVNNPIVVDGFTNLPAGFYKEGFGLTSGGNLALNEIHNKFNKNIDLTIKNTNSSKIDARGRSVKVELSHRQLSKLNEVVRTIKRERNEDMRVEVQHFLGATFTQFKDLRDTYAGYIPGRLAEILGQDSVISKLSTEDREALENLIPDYLSNIPGSLKAKKKLQVIFESWDAGKKIYLKKVLEEFRKKLERNSKSESIWQKFLSDYILVLRSNYGEVLEKESVSLQGKFPDFMLVDPYGYLDIYEIKKPSTNMLKLDPSRNNYYWDTEISKAIAQVENYAHQSQRQADTLSNDIRKAKGVEVNIVRPRGYIIAGRRSQLISPKMQDDFRILCDSLSNIDVILYDDLLEGLETFVSRAGAET